MDMIQEWLKIGRRNAWIKDAWDPPFDERSFEEVTSVEELKEELYRGNWAIGTAFYYNNICFINQVDGGDEFLVIRGKVTFESISARVMIANGDFDDFIKDVEVATDEQLKNLTYRRREDISSESLSEHELDFFMPDQFMALSDESEAKAEMEKFTGGPIFAVNTLLEDVYLTKPFYEDILCDYDKKKNTLSREGLEKLSDLVLANATVFRTIYKTICEGFNDGVEYLSGKTLKKFSTPDALIAEYEKGSPLSFITVVNTDDDRLVHLHIVFFTPEGKLIPDTSKLSEEEIETLLGGSKDGGEERGM